MLIVLAFVFLLLDLPLSGYGSLSFDFIPDCVGFALLTAAFLSAARKASPDAEKKSGRTAWLLWALGAFLALLACAANDYVLPSLHRDAVPLWLELLLWASLIAAGYLLCRRAYGLVCERACARLCPPSGEELSAGRKLTDTALLLILLCEIAAPAGELLGQTLTVILLVLRNFGGILATVCAAKMQYRKQY